MGGRDVTLRRCNVDGGGQVDVVAGAPTWSSTVYRCAFRRPAGANGAYPGLRQGIDECAPGDCFGLEDQ